MATENSSSLLTRENLPKAENTPDPKPRPWMEKVFPSGFLNEFKPLVHLAWPAVLATLCNTLMGVVSLVFCGHLGREELDAAGISISLLNITGTCVFYGLSTACDTLFSQAFGANKKKLFGIFLQRSLVVLALTTLLCWGIHLNAELILILLSQNRTVAKLAGVYCLYFMPGLLAMTVVLIKYLQNQNRVIPTVVIGGIANAVNLLAQYLAIFVMEAGLIGSSLAQVISYFTMLVLSIAYIILGGIYKDNWPGLSIHALEHWGQFVFLAVAGMFMVATEWWVFEIGIFMNGVLGVVELGATVVIYQVELLLYMIPFGLSVACSVRVGQSLGAGDARAALTIARVAQVMAFLGFLLMAIVLLSLRRILPRLFTHDEEVINLYAETTPIIVLLVFFACLITTSMGILRGCGKQWMAAAFNTIAYIFIAIPLDAIFLFVLKIGSTGVWWGLVIGMTCAACCYTYFLVFRVDWEDEVITTKKRLNQKSTLVSGEGSPLIAEFNDSGKLGYTGKETEKLVESRKENGKTRLVIRRAISCSLVFSILAAGLCVRLFVPLPHDITIDVLNISNTTDPLHYLLNSTGELAQLVYNVNRSVLI